jgi:lysophospholipase L1-like esterase
MIIAGGVALALAALAVIAELGARWWIRDTGLYHVWTPGMRRILRLSPDISPHLESVVHFSVNSDGERGAEVEPGLDMYRVLVAGGSPVESLFHDQDTGWPGLLERSLSTTASLQALKVDRVHVGNIGRSGVGAQELDLIFERVLPRYRMLDAIVIMIGGADVVHWLEHGAPSPYPATPVPVRSYFSVHPEGPFSWTPRRSALRELARRVRHRRFRPTEVIERAGDWMHRARDMRADATEVRHRVPDPEVMLARFEHHFRRLLRRARGHARRVVFVVQPFFEKEQYSATESAQFWHGGMGVAWRDKVLTYYSDEVANHLMRQLERRAIEVTDDFGVERVSVRSALEPSIENYYDWLHYTPAGAAVIAKAVSAALLRPHEVSAARQRAPSVEMA